MLLGLLLPQAADAAPAPPRDVYAEALRPDQVRLSWRPGAEPPGGGTPNESYQVFRNGELIAETNELRLTDSWLLERSGYSYVGASSRRRRGNRRGGSDHDHDTSLPGRTGARPLPPAAHVHLGRGRLADLRSRDHEPLPGAGLRTSDECRAAARASPRSRGHGVGARAGNALHVPLGVGRPHRAGRRVSHPAGCLTQLQLRRDRRLRGPDPCRASEPKTPDARRHRPGNHHR